MINPNPYIPAAVVSAMETTYSDPQFLKKKIDKQLFELRRKYQHMSNDYSKVEVIAFDLFNTVFDPASANKADAIRYTEVLKVWRETGTHLAPRQIDSFAKLRMFPDSLTGLCVLQRQGYRVVAASNIPAFYVHKMTRFATHDAIPFEWDHIMAFEDMRKYKPALSCYAAICDDMGCTPGEVLFVTGNHGAGRSIGDDTEPLKIGMQTLGIRRDSEVKDLLDLAELMGRHK